MYLANFLMMGSFIFTILLFVLVVLGIYTLLLVIKALNIYIRKNS